MDNKSKVQASATRGLVKTEGDEGPVRKMEKEPKAKAKATPKV